MLRKKLTPWPKYRLIVVDDNTDDRLLWTDPDNGPSSGAQIQKIQKIQQMKIPREIPEKGHIMGEVTYLDISTSEPEPEPESESGLTLSIPISINVGSFDLKINSDKSGRDMPSEI
mgnify:CR=1 FL=1